MVYNNVQSATVHKAATAKNIWANPHSMYSFMGKFNLGFQGNPQQAQLNLVNWWIILWNVISHLIPPLYGLMGVIIHFIKLYSKCKHWSIMVYSQCADQYIADLSRGETNLKKGLVNKPNFPTIKQ